MFILKICKIIPKTKDKFANMWYYKRSHKISEIKKETNYEKSIEK